MMWRLIQIALGLLVLLAVTTWLALERSGVAVITTRSKSGEPRETHVWFARDSNNKLWLEAGAPQNPWFVDIQSNPELSLIAEDLSGDYHTTVVPGRDATAQVRNLLREKYGLRDRWVGLFVTASESTAVELSPGSGPAALPPAAAEPGLGSPP